MPQLAIEPTQAAPYRLDPLIKTAEARQRGEAADYSLAGHIASLVPSHAVGNRPTTMLRAIQECIFVASTLSTLQRAPGTAPGKHLIHNCSGRRKVRHAAISKGLGLRWLVSR
jgi:hypothetical protein